MLIPLLPEDVPVSCLPYLMVLTLSGFSDVRKAAEDSWEKLNPEKLLRKPLGKKSKLDLEVYIGQLVNLII